MTRWPLVVDQGTPSTQGSFRNRGIAILRCTVQPRLWQLCLSVMDCRVLGSVEMANTNPLRSELKLCRCRRRNDLDSSCSRQRPCRAARAAGVPGEGHARDQERQNETRWQMQLGPGQTLPAQDVAHRPARSARSRWPLAAAASAHPAAPSQRQWGRSAPACRQSLRGQCTGCLPVIAPG